MLFYYRFDQGKDWKSINNKLDKISDFQLPKQYMLNSPVSLFSLKRDMGYHTVIY